jgi:hypothetical protein
MRNRKNDTGLKSYTVQASTVLGGAEVGYIDGNAGYHSESAISIHHWPNRSIFLNPNSRVKLAIPVTNSKIILLGKVEWAHWCHYNTNKDVYIFMECVRSLIITHRRN